MIPKGAAALAVLALVALTHPVVGQTVQLAQTRPSTLLTATTPASRPAAASANQIQPGNAPSDATAPAGQSDCFGGNCDLPQPRISISTPAPAPAPWPWQEKISWAANLILVVLGYAGIMMALTMMRKIERQGKYIEEATHAAAESARVALMLVESKGRAERPWVLISVRPANNDVNGFTVTATNRGRGPARILSMVDETVCALDEKHLDPVPAFKKEPAAPPEPTILLPEETIELVSFSRSDAKQVCETDERMKRVEDWVEKIYLYGKVVYQDLTAPDDAPALESSWLCWYIHGRQQSGMVMAGSAVYNRHT